jgi:hypothetical protein
MSDVSDAINEAVEKAHESRLNSVIALSVAVSATWMALCNVKGGNVVQAMAKTQVASNNRWSYFQAKSTKQAIAESAVVQLEIERDAIPGLTAEGKAEMQTKIDRYKTEVARYAKEKDEIKKTAETLEKEYDRLSFKDDQFDIGEASTSVALALFGVTALTQKRWLLVVAFVFACFGALIGVLGFAGSLYRPEWLAKLLG